MSCCICLVQNGSSVCPRCSCVVCSKCWRTYTSTCYKDYGLVKCPICRYDEIEIADGPDTRSKTQPKRKAELVRELSRAISSTSGLPCSEHKMQIVRGIFQTLHNLRNSDIDLLRDHTLFRETVRLKLLEMYHVDGWQGAATFHILLYGQHPE